MKQYVFACLLLFGCAAIQSTDTGSEINQPIRVGLTEVRQLKINETTMAEAEKILGAPEKKMLLEKDPESVIWIFFRDQYRSNPRLSLVFDKSTGLLALISWSIRDTDPESNVQRAMKLFPNAHFKLLPQEWIADYASDDRIYEDAVTGVQIVFREMRNEVEAIVWKRPQLADKK